MFPVTEGQITECLLYLRSETIFKFQDSPLLLQHVQELQMAVMSLKEESYRKQVTILWGPEIRTHPDFESSRGGQFAKGLDFKWDL